MLFTVTADFVSGDVESQRRALDSQVAQALSELTTPAMLSPLPVLGVPGWRRENENARFYDNTEYFRSARRKPLFSNASAGTPGRVL
jgi:hypothetical protein